MALEETIESTANSNDAQATRLAFERLNLPVGSDAHRSFSIAIEQHRIFAVELRGMLAADSSQRM